MMQRSTHCFDDDHLRRLLEDTLGESERAAIVDHLDRCLACADGLERVAAADDFWQSSAHSLRTDAFDSQCFESVDSAKPFSPVLKALLGPTEDPYSLGRVGRFEILGVVGSGGMGTVLKARDVDIDRVVALKLPAAHLLDSPAALERLEREARSAATIRHPSIIEIYQVERWRDIPYLVMPFHTGPSLTARINADGPMDVLESIQVARQMAEALAAAHDCGVVHRDVKPGNILLGKGTERAVLTDFGIAKIQSDAQMTATGVIVGTPAFLSPEQASGGEATPQSDLFCLGSVLWSMLAGRPPFVDLPTHTIVASIAAGKLPSLRPLRSGLPPWVYRLVETLQQPAPEKRPNSAHQCAEILRACEQHLADPILHPLPAIVNTPTKTNRRVWKWAILLAALLGGSTIYLRPQPTNGDTKFPPGLGTPAAPVESETASVEELSRSVDEIDRELAELMSELTTMAIDHDSNQER